MLFVLRPIPSRVVDALYVTNSCTRFAYLAVEAAQPATTIMGSKARSRRFGKSWNISCSVFPAWQGWPGAQTLSQNDFWRSIRVSMFRTVSTLQSNALLFRWPHGTCFRASINGARTKMNIGVLAPRTATYEAIRQRVYISLPFILLP